jgi:hypothetical protein
MSEMQFEEDFIEEKAEENSNAPTPRLVKWVLKTGIVKSEKKANVVLVIVALLFFALSIYFFVNAF